MDELDSGIKQSEKYVTAMERWFCCPFGSTKTAKDASWEYSVTVCQQEKLRNSLQTPYEVESPSKGHFERITNDAREDEMEQNLNAIGGICDNLLNMAHNMGAEVEKQNQMIDVTIGKAEKTNYKMKNVNERIKKL